MKRGLLLFLCVFFLSSEAFSKTRGDALFPKSVGGGFGVQIKGWLAQDDDLARIGAAGFGFVRFAIGWAEIETEKGVYDWRETDALVQRVRGAGLKMVITLLGGHALYDGAVAAPPNNVDRVVWRARASATPESVDSFARFAALAALRYGVDDIVWEIWNEPDLPRFWAPKADAARYAVLAETACGKIRAVSPDAVVVAPGLGRIPDPRDGVSSSFLEAYLSSGAASCSDGLSVHPYRHGPETPEALFKDYRRLFPLMARHGFYKNLLNTEWGYTGTQVPEEKRADFALRTRLLDVMWGVPVSIWYEWKDSGDDPADDEARFGLVRADGSSKPALEAIEKVLPLLRDAVLVRQIHVPDPRDILLLFRGKTGEKTLVGWSVRDKNLPSVAFLADARGVEGRLSSRPEILGVSREIDDVSLNDF